MSTRTDLEPLPDREETELIDFARRWEPFGGAGDGEVFVGFGITLAQYRQRLASALTPERCAELGTAFSSRLQHYAGRHESPSFTAQ